MYNPKSEEVKRAEQMMTPEQRLFSRLREKVLSEGFEIPEPISDQRKEELENEIGDVAKIFNGYGRPWFTAGGTALELVEGKLTRDHQDNDIAIFYEDVGDFFGYTTQLGYEFFDVKGKKIENTKELLAQKENAFVMKSDESKPGLRGFEVIFLRRNAQGDITFGHDDRLAFSKNLYENAPKYTNKNGEVAPITPKDIELLYKISDGRNKDLHDIKKFLPTLTAEERQRLDGYLETIGATFVVGEQETKNLDELLQLAEARTRILKENFLVAKVDTIISEDFKNFDETIGKIFEVASRLDSSKSFLVELVNEFGERAQTWSIAELDKVIKFLFREHKPTLEEFKTAFSSEPHIEERLKKESLTMPRWEMKTKSENVGK